MGPIRASCYDYQVTDDHGIKTSNKISTSEQYTTSGIGKENLERRLGKFIKRIMFCYNQSNISFTVLKTNNNQNMKVLKCLVDDEPPAIRLLENM
jgi:hypothetical protein